MRETVEATQLTDNLLTRLQHQQATIRRVLWRSGTLYGIGTIEKDGRRFGLYASGQGRVLLRCQGSCCQGLPSWRKFNVLPCQCHGLVVDCTCSLRDKRCRGCGRVFLPHGHGHTWYAIEDPHGKPNPTA